MTLQIRTKILALDIATSTGWAFYDTSGHHSAIKNGTFNVGVGIPKQIDGKDITKTERRRRMRANLHGQLEELFGRFSPLVVCLEQPLAAIVDNKEKPAAKSKFGRRSPALTGWVVDDEGGGKEGGGPNASTVFALNQLFGGVDLWFRAKGCFLMEVAPVTWQKLTAKLPGSDTKKRSIAFCDLLGIAVTGTNQTAKGDAADASVIAYWAAGRCQEVKLEKMKSQGEIHFAGEAA